MHGLGSSCTDFLHLGRDSLATILSNSGYDVYLANSRGVNNLKHKRLSKDSSEFWNFSVHELGIYDLPAKIDYILRKTKRKSLSYIGHSQAGTSLLIMLSMRPEYNRKLRDVHLLAPGAFLAHSPTSPFWIICRLVVREN
jgi:pimeloyl-ACP methyl ester carboxylesterase